MDSSSRILTTKDLAHNLCTAVSHAVQQDTDMVIVSRDKQLVPCHSSLLALFSPVVAHLLSDVPCCSPPTIFLPDFHAQHIRKLLHILGSGQAVPGETVDTDIKKIIMIAKVLQIAITDLSVGLYLDNPLGVPFEVKQELNGLYVKQDVKQEEKSVKIESMEEHEYIEKDITEKTIKRELAAQVDDDKLLDDINDSEAIVQEEGHESNAFDQLLNGFPNWINRDTSSEFGKGPFTSGEFEKGLLTSGEFGEAQATATSNFPPGAWQCPDRFCGRQNLYANTVCQGCGVWTVFDGSNQIAENVTVKGPTMSFVQTSTPSPMPVISTQSSSPPTVGHQVATKMMYPCPQCGKDFFDSKSLAEHTRHNHKLYTCRKPGCDEQTVGYYRILAHNKAAHKKTPSAFGSLGGNREGQQFNLNWKEMRQNVGGRNVNTLPLPKSSSSVIFKPCAPSKSQLMGPSLLTDSQRHGPSNPPNRNTSKPLKAGGQRGSKGDWTCSCGNYKFQWRNKCGECNSSFVTQLFRTIN